MISIIMPAYNAEKTINDSINSIVNQTFVDWELLVINDGSVDNTQRIIDDWKKKDNRIKCILIENSGPSYARTLGIENSRGEYIAFCDSDDEMEEEMLNHMIEKMNDENDLVVCRYGGKKESKEFDSEKHFSQQEAISSVIESNEFGGYLWNKLFKKRIIQDNEICFDSDIFCCEDLLFVVQYVLNCKQVALVPECLYRYNDTPNSLTNQKFSWKKISNILARKKIAELMREKGSKENIRKAEKTLLEQSLFAYGQIKKYMKTSMITNHDKKLYNSYYDVIKMICRKYGLRNLLYINTTLKFKIYLFILLL